MRGRSGRSCVIEAHHTDPHSCNQAVSTGQTHQEHQKAVLTTPPAFGMWRIDHACGLLYTPRMDSAPNLLDIAAQSEASQLSPRPRWAWGLVVALALHGAVGAAFMVRFAAPEPQSAPQAALSLSYAEETPPLAAVTDTPAETIIPVDLAAFAPPAPSAETPAPEEAEAPPQPEPPPPAQKPRAMVKPAAKAAPVAVSSPASLPVTAARASTAPPSPVAAPVPAEATAPQAPPVQAGASSQAQQQWQASLMAHLMRHKVYPRQARVLHQEGVATVRLTLSQNGDVLAVELVSSSNSASLDAESLALIERAQPLPVPPSAGSFPLSLTLPIRFTLRS